MSNVKTNGANMLTLGKHAKLSSVTFLSDLRLRTQRSKKVEFKKYCYRPVSSILHTMIIIAKTMHQIKTCTLSIPWGQRSILGHFGVLKKPAAGSMSSRWHSRMSSFFFLLTICFFSRMLNWISTKLGQNDQWVSGYKSYQQFDLKGHVGVTGVKKVNHMKNMKTALISKLIMSSCRQQTKLQKSQWWPCHTTPHIGVKGQNVSYFQFF